MKIIRSDIPIELTVLLVILTILLAFILIPFLFVIGLCWVVRRIITGASSDGLIPREKVRRRTPFCEGPDHHARAEQNMGNTGDASSDADTIDCEVISSRTFDENGQEIP